MQWSKRPYLIDEKNHPGVLIARTAETGKAKHSRNGDGREKSLPLPCAVAKSLGLRGLPVKHEAAAKRRAAKASGLLEAVHRLALLDPPLDRFLVETPIAADFEGGNAVLPQEAVNGRRRMNLQEAGHFIQCVITVAIR